VVGPEKDEKKKPCDASDGEELATNSKAVAEEEEEDMEQPVDDAGVQKRLDGVDNCLEVVDVAWGEAAEKGKLSSKEGGEEWTTGRRRRSESRYGSELR
jgi:hypothetical protein